MKKFIVAALTSFVALTSFSFTVNPKTSKESLNFARYFILLSQSQPLGETGCAVSVSILIVFNWEGEGHPITNVTISSPQFTINCGGIARIVNGTVTNLGLDETTAHCTDIQFGLTGDNDLDTLLSDPSFIGQIKGEIDDQVDAQKE